MQNIQCESTFIKDLHIITRPFTFPYPHTTCIVLYSNPTLIYTVTNPDLYIGGGGGGGGAVIHTYMFFLSAHPDPEIRWGGGGNLKKKIFWPFRHQFGGSPSVPKFFCAVGKICSQVKQGFPF